MKPRVMRLVIFTAGVGMFASQEFIHPVIAIASIILIGLGAGASGALNMWWDADIDEIMDRTRSRPVPRGIIKAEDALSFGVFLSFFQSFFWVYLLIYWLHYSWVYHRILFGCIFDVA